MFNVPVSEFGFIPTRISNCALWLDAADASTITQVAGAVSQWNDKSGNGNNATQGTGANQPVTGSATLNGNNVLTWSSSKAMLLPPALYIIGGGDNTIFAVYATSATNTQQVILTTANGSTLNYLLFINSSSQNVYRNGGSNTAAAAQVTTPVSSGFRRSGTALNGFFNGVETTSALGTNTSGQTSAVVGSRPGLTNSFLGSMAEIIIFTRSITNQELDTLGNYAKLKWGSPWTDL